MSYVFKCGAHSSPQELRDHCRKAGLAAYVVLDTTVVLTDDPAYIEERFLCNLLRVS